MEKIIKYILTLVILCFSNLVLSNDYSEISYVITPKFFNNKILYIKIDTKFIGKLSDKIVINFPHRWGGNKYDDQIKNIAFISPKIINKIENINSPQKTIHLSQNSNHINFSYEIYKKNESLMNEHEDILYNDLIHVIGYGALAVPDDLEINKKIRFRLIWENIPKKWRTISSHGLSKHISFTGNPSQLLQAFYAAGQLRSYKIDNLYLSFYGYFDLPDNLITSYLNEIIKTQRFFFKDHNYPYYAISLIEWDNPSSAGGVGLYNSFVLHFPKDLNKEMFYSLFAHEHLHNWIGVKINSNEKEEGLHYWWSEGFTEYYSRVLALRSNGISIDAFVKQCNQFLRDYYLSPVINEPNIKIMKNFWNSADMEKLPYYRGFVFAIYLNYLIKNNTSKGSLDNVMLDLFKGVNTHKLFSINEFKNVVKNYIPAGIDKEISEFIINGKTISLKKVMNLLPLKKVSMGKFNLGFVSKDRIIKKIYKNSNAYKSGLRKGYKIIGDSPDDIDPSKEIIIETNHGIFRFKPEDQYNKKEVYQFKTPLSDKDKIEIKNFFNSI